MCDPKIDLQYKKQIWNHSLDKLQYPNDNGNRQFSYNQIFREEID